MRAFKGLHSKLALYQKRASKKVKGSRNYEKVQKKVRRLFETISNRRKDHLHKITTRLSKNHAIIVVEDIDVRQMTKSAKGTKENPGRCVRQKRGLNTAIRDQGWGELFNQLEYKVTWNGGCLVKVPPAYTSRTCSRCKHECKENRTTQSKFLCTKCGFTENADVNAAMNILAAGQVAIACGGADKAGAKVPAA